METPIPIVDAIDAVAARLSGTTEQAWADIKSKAIDGRLSLAGLDDKGRRCSIEPHWLSYIEPWGSEDPPPPTAPGKRFPTSDIPQRDSGSMIGFDRVRAVQDRLADKGDGRELRSIPPLRIRAIVADGKQLDTLWARAEIEFKNPDWSLGNVLSWIAFRDPALICGLDGLSDLRAQRRYRGMDNPLPLAEHSEDADKVLLNALQAGGLTAIRNGLELPSTYWFGKYLSDLTQDLRFRRSEVMAFASWPDGRGGTPGTADLIGSVENALWTWPQAVIWAIWRDNELVVLSVQNSTRYAERASDRIRAGLRPAGSEQELRDLLRSGRLAARGNKGGANGSEPIAADAWPEYAGMPAGWSEHEIMFDAPEVRQQLPYIPEGERPPELTADPDWVVEKAQRRRRRLRWLNRFREYQRRRREWFSFPEIADWCARTPGTVGRDETLRAQAYDDLREAMLAGDFGRGARSRVLYFEPEAGQARERLRLAPEGLQTWLDLYGAENRIIVDHILSRCWLPRDLCRLWFERQGLLWPSAFDPLDASTAAPPGGAISPTPRTSPGPKGGEAKASAIVWEIAEQVLADDTKRPPPGHGQLTRLARAIKPLLQARGHAREVDTITKYIRGSFKEWQAKSGETVTGAS